jgi:hypothetical protein
VTHQPRVELVARLARDLERFTAPRIQLLIMMIVAGGAAFLASALLLWSPAQTFELMAPRYAAAALCGYLAFILLIRVWIALHRPPGDGPGLDALDVLDAIGPNSSVPSVEPPALFGGGRSGGGGYSTRWSASGSGDSGPSFGLGLDLEDGIWLIVAAACAAAGVVAIGYVVYMAPILLAEVALDAAIISVLYRRLRRDEQGHWLFTVVRHTWIPALVLVLFAFAAGYALQQVAPDARSIGAVLQSFSAAR